MEQTRVQWTQSVPARPVRFWTDGFDASEAEYTTEDGGAAHIIEFNDATDDADDAPGLFVRVQSWDPAGAHDALQPFLGQLVRVTVEVITHE